MTRKYRRSAALVLMLLLAGACGQKPSTIRDSAAARAKEFQYEAPAEPSEEVGNAGVATPADAGVSAPEPAASDSAAAPPAQPIGDGNAPVLGLPAPASTPAASGPLRPTRLRQAAAAASDASSPGAPSASPA